MAPPTGVAAAGRPLVIPLFIPHLGCPHRCVFCNQRAITGAAAKIPSEKQIREEVKRFLAYGRKRPSTIEISFFGGNFLGLKMATATKLLRTAASFVERRQVHGLRFSTRPDTVSPQTLDGIEPFPVSTVELGVQSMIDRVLESAGRGHTAADTITAAAMLKARGYRLGLQMMVGLPSDNAVGAMESARRLADLRPDFVRIYPTLVLDGSPLAQRFRRGQYHPLPLENCVALVKRLYLHFKERNIPVVRMGLQASDGLADNGSLLAGPYHPSFGHLVHGEIVFDAISAALGSMRERPPSLTIIAHPNRVSRVQGLNKRNFRRLEKVFGMNKIVVLQDDDLNEDCLVVAGQPINLP
jgi:histone acetyltransferase (RNA polymerase elongator complex component)